MADVNLLSYGWQTNKTNSSITITTSSDAIKFRMPTSASTKTGWAKGCISFDASKYSSVTLKYRKITTDGITDLYFGVYDSISASSNNPSTTSLVTSSFNKSNGGTITFTIPSSVSGTKYVGFRFYGNSNGTTYGSNEYIYITSFTATERGYTLTYDANGGSGGPSAVKDITSTTISSTVPTRDGYEFLGWSTSSYATSASYVAGNSISLSYDIILYAVWRKLYTITYNANGGSNAPSATSKKHGQTVTLNSASPTPPTNTSITNTVTFNANGGTCDQNMVMVNHVVSYEFTHWNTEPDGSGISYQPSELYSYDMDVTLYAQYASTTTYKSITLPTPSRENYYFLGWSIDDYDASGITGEYIPYEDTVLYAIWKIKGQVYICDKLDGFSPYKVLIYDGSGWNQYVPYIYTYSGWEIYSG
jgi:hypothetical protein